MANNENKTNDQEQNENAGKLSGIGAGVITGAAIGTSILPIVGTFVGGVVGGVVGSEVGKKVGGSLLDRFGGKSGAADTKDVSAELEKLAQLHKKGVLNDEEFAAAKARLLNL